MAALAGTYLLSLARGCHIVRRSLHGGLSQGSINFKHLHSTSLHERRRFICRGQLRANHTRLFGIRAMSTEAESAANNPGLCETPDEATKAYFMQQTMYRIKDPKISLDFYTRVLGMTLLKRLDFPDSKFSLYFLGYENPADAPKDTLERVQWTFSCKATIELTHNWGTESDPDFKGYHNGNSDPRGFGHIGITVDDTYTACERFEKLGVQFVKKPDEGRMKGLAFIKDPDGYWIETSSAWFQLQRKPVSTETKKIYQQNEMDLNNTIYPI